MQTPDEVLAEMLRRGYEITPRRLVDWRQKQLLPPLVKHGLGTGRGWIYVWEDPWIVEQVIAVQELLWIHERTSWLYIPLWCLGFDVPLERVRMQLRAKLERGHALLTNGAQERSSIADTVSALAFREATRAGPRTGRQASVDVLEYWLTLLAGDTDYSPDLEAWSQIAAAVAAFGGSGTRYAAEAGEHLWTPAGLRLLRRWTRRYASLPRLEEAARKATDAEWAAVHLDWQALAHLVEVIGGYAEDDLWEEFFSFWLRVVAIAGPWMSLVDLSMRWRGQGQVWDNIRHELASMRERLEQEPSLREQLNEQWQMFGAYTASK